MQFGIANKPCKVGLSVNERAGLSFSESRSSDAQEISYGIEEKSYKVGRSLSESGSFVDQHIPFCIEEISFKVGRSSVTQDIPFGIEEKLFKNYELIAANENPACDVMEANSMYERAFRYSPVLYRALYKTGFTALALGVSGKDLRTGIVVAYDAIFDHFNRILQKINSSKQIVQIATVVGGRRIGDLMALATKKVGKEGLFVMSHVKNTVTDELEFSNGMELFWTFEPDLVDYFCTYKRKPSSALGNPLVLIHDNTVSNRNVVMPAIRKAINTVRGFVWGGPENLGPIGPVLIGS